MRSAALIGLIARIVMAGTNDMAAAQASDPAVTVVDDGSARGSVELPLGRALEVQLGANPTTGYTWRLDAGSAPGLRLKSRRYQSSAPPGPPFRAGAGGIDHFVFEAGSNGIERLHFEYRRGDSGAAARTFDLTVTVVP